MLGDNGNAMREHMRREQPDQLRVPLKENVFHVLYWLALAPIAVGIMLLSPLIMILGGMVGFGIILWGVGATVASMIRAAIR